MAVPMVRTTGWTHWSCLECVCKGGGMDGAMRGPQWLPTQPLSTRDFDSPTCHCALIRHFISSHLSLCTDQTFHILLECIHAVNWCSHWFEYFPNPPLNVLAMIENCLAHHDGQLLERFIKHDITSHVRCVSVFVHFGLLCNCNSTCIPVGNFWDIDTIDIHAGKQGYHRKKISHPPNATPTQCHTHLMPHPPNVTPTQCPMSH